MSSSQPALYFSPMFLLSVPVPVLPPVGESTHALLLLQPEPEPPAEEEALPGGGHQALLHGGRRCRGKEKAQVDQRNPEQILI